MIALDTNVLVRYLVRDDTKQADTARVLMESLTENRPDYICRSVGTLFEHLLHQESEIHLR